MPPIDRNKTDGPEWSMTHSGPSVLVRQASDSSAVFQYYCFEIPQHRF